MEGSIIIDELNSDDNKETIQKPKLAANLVNDTSKKPKIPIIK
jgi:hypothetical protein